MFVTVKRILYTQNNTGIVRMNKSDIKILGMATLGFLFGTMLRNKVTAVRRITG